MGNTEELDDALDALEAICRRQAEELCIYRQITQLLLRAIAEDGELIDRLLELCQRGLMK